MSWRPGPGVRLYGGRRAGAGRRTPSVIPYDIPHQVLPALSHALGGSSVGCPALSPWSDLVLRARSDMHVNSVTARGVRRPRTEGDRDHHGRRSTQTSRGRLWKSPGRPRWSRRPYPPRGRGQGARGRRIVAARAALRRRLRATVPARLRLLRAATVLLAVALGILLLVAGLAANGTWDDVADRDAPRTTSAAGLNLAHFDAPVAAGRAGPGRDHRSTALGVRAVAAGGRADRTRAAAPAGRVPLNAVRRPPAAPPQGPATAGAAVGSCR